MIPTISSETLSKKIRQIQKNTGSSRAIALISTDVENFHYINDKYGYSLGNEILNIIYEELAGASFTVFTTRFFSDVFVSIVDITDLTNEALLSQISKLDQQISQRIRNTYHVNFFRTNSGICFIQDANTSPETVLSCANVARRLSKKMIPPCCIYSKEIDQQEKDAGRNPPFLSSGSEK
ncbi:MAG: diguanylate cyclase [Blautia massiliensis (ex Durand et al. 2017)]